MFHTYLCITYIVDFSCTARAALLPKLLTDKKCPPHLYYTYMGIWHHQSILENFIRIQGLR